MIDFPCPKCGHFLSVPSSLAGQSDSCPACGNVCGVPQAPGVMRIARALDKTGRSTVGAVAFCRRHKKAVSIIGVNVLILGGLLSWLLPDWLPRPKITFDSPRRAHEGLFPSLGQMTRELEAAGYYPSRSEPTEGILRGRRLWRRTYMLDINKPDIGFITLWSALDDRDRVTAIMTDFAEKSAIVVFQAIDDQDCQQRLQARETHLLNGPKILRAFSGIDLIPDVMSRKPAPGRIQAKVDGSNVTLERVETHKGFELEILVEGIQTKVHQDPMFLRTVLILKDRTWK